MSCVQVLVILSIQVVDLKWKYVPDDSEEITDWTDDEDKLDSAENILDHQQVSQVYLVFLFWVSQIVILLNNIIDSPQIV